MIKNNPKISFNGQQPLKQPQINSQSQESHSNPISQTSSSKFNTGRWTTEQCRLFSKYYTKIGKNWNLIALEIPSRSAEQVRSHAQKYISRRLRKENQQKEQEQAKRQIALGQTKRTTRTCKNRQVYIEEDLCIKQNQPKQSRKKKNCQKSKQISLTTIETDFREDNSAKNTHQSIFPNFNQQNQKKNIPKTSPFIQMPQPDFGYVKEPSLNPSMFYQTILPFFESGLPIPLFIYNNNENENNKNYEKPISVSENVIENQSPKKGFVSFKRNQQTDQKENSYEKECQYSGFKNENKIKRKPILSICPTIENLIIGKSLQKQQI